MTEDLHQPALPDLSVALLERMYPRTCLALEAGEKIALAAEFSQLSNSSDWNRLPGILARRKRSGGRGFVADLARMEIQLRLSIHAPELPRSGFERVSEADEPMWYHARFRFDPAMSLLESDWPLDEVYSRPQESYSLSSSVILIYRDNGKPAFRRLQANEELLLKSLSLSVPLGKVLDRPNGPDFDSRIFQRWTESGLLRTIVWASV